jgi:hypothetical protein
LIYSRQKEAALEAALTALLNDLHTEHPGLRARIHPFGLLDHGPPRWINSSTGAELKLAIKDILHLR